MKAKGILITFEGGEGCGKTTHSKSLKKYLQRKGYKVILTHEPGGTELGQSIRRILLFNKSSLTSYTELMLFAADRIEHMERVVLPALREGNIVISDRFIDSTTAYQIGGRGLPEDVVRYINAISSNGVIPDLTFILDVSPSIGIKRGMKGRSLRDRFERQNLEFHERVRALYLRIASEASSRIKVINSEKTKSEVELEIREIANEYLAARG